MWKYAVFVLVAGAAIAAIAAVYWQKAGPAFADASDAARFAQGTTVYADQGGACHGANLEGQPNWRQRRADGLLPAPPHDETGHTWHHLTRISSRLRNSVPRLLPARTIRPIWRRSATC